VKTDGATMPDLKGMRWETMACFRTADLMPTERGG